MSGNTSQLYRFKSHRFECLGGVDSLNRLSRFEMNYENLNDIDSNYLKVFFREKIVPHALICKMECDTRSELEICARHSIRKKNSGALDAKP